MERNHSLSNILRYSYYSSTCEPKSPLMLSYYTPLKKLWKAETVEPPTFAQSLPLTMKMGVDLP